CAAAGDGQAGTSAVRVVPADSRGRATPVPCSAASTDELVLDGCRVEAARREQDVAVEPEVGELLDEPLVALGRPGERRFDPLLTDLAGGGGLSGGEQRRDV